MAWFDSGWGLSLIVFLPLVGAGAVLLIPKAREGAVKSAALGFSAASFLLAVLAVTRFDFGATEQFHFGTDLSWIPAIGSRFHIGVVANLRGRHSQAVRIFEQVAGARQARRATRIQAVINLARIHYEAERYPEAMRYYARIPRESPQWLEAIFESGWTFFMMHKHNNVLGNRICARTR